MEVIDPRSHLPFDYPLLHASLRKTERLIFFNDSNRTCGLAAEVAAHAAEQLFTYLKAPVARVTRADVPVPFSIALDKHVLPSGAQLEEAIRRILDTSTEEEETVA